MSISSMTGFARVDGSYEDRRWVWELKSVNSRGLEIRFRLPPGHDFIEPLLREKLKKIFSRGAININLALKADSGDMRYTINNAMLDETIRAVEEIKLRTDCDKPRPEGILNVRGVIELDEGDESEAERANFGKVLSASFEQAVAALKEARDQEGAALSTVVAAQIAEIEKLTIVAQNSEAADLQNIRDRIAAQLSELIRSDAVVEERLSQEAALLAVKADIREELDRLKAHAAAGKELLLKNEPLGRRLDFLTQEFNREANTLCSKAQDMDLKQLGLALKTVIDQMREQVQNIE